MASTQNIEIAIYPDKIPQDLRTLPQWVVWKLQTRKGKLTKVPFHPQTGTFASTTDPRTWSDFDTACRVFEQGNYDGVGFVFTNKDPFCGIDLDKCRDPKTGTIEPWAQAIIEKLDSYTEISPSDRGVHIIIEGQLPEGQRRRGQIELYETGRYFTMTGHHLDETPDCIHNRQAEIEVLHAEVFGPRENAQKESHTGKSSSTFSDDEVLGRARKSKNADKFERLWSGDWTEYASQSEGDLALCSILAFWTEGNAEQIDRLFRQSGLFREKWDEKHHGDGRTYGQGTVQIALQQANEAYAGKGADTYSRESGQKGAQAGKRIFPTLDPAALYGLAGDFVRLLEPHTEADPVAMLVHAIAEFSCVIGRGSGVKLDGAFNPLLINAVIVGDTSKARKGTANKRIGPIFKQAIPGWTRGETKGNLSSGEGLVYAVRDATYKKEPIKEKGKPTGKTFTICVDPGVSDKRLCLVQSEFGSMLKVMAREGNSLSGVIRDAWDGEDLAPMTKSLPIRATRPHIVIIGHVTEEDLVRHLNKTEMWNGFANRFVWVIVKRSKLLPFPTEPPAHLLSPLCKRLEEAVRFATPARTLRMTREAKEAWCEIYGVLSEGGVGMVGALLSRAEAQVWRLAALYALLDLSEVIKRVHLKAALALWQYGEDSVQYIFGNVTGDTVADKILNTLRQRGPLSDSEISALFQKNVSKDDLERAKTMLSKRGLIRSVMQNTKGRSRTVWAAL